MSRFSNPLSTFDRSCFIKASRVLFSTVRSYPQTALMITSRRSTACGLRIMNSSSRNSVRVRLMGLPLREAA